VPDLKRYLLLSQITLIGLLLVCSLIMPSVAIKNGGVSNFGNHRSTVVLYVLAFLLSALFLSLAAKAVGQRRAAGLLLLLVVLDILVLVSTFPRQLNQTFSDIHDDLGIVLFAYQFVLSVVLVIKRYSLRGLLLLVLEVTGSIIGLLSIIKVIHFLFIGQMLGALGFGLLLVTTFPLLVAASQPKTD
jgi:hypothetical protein